MRAINRLSAKAVSAPGAGKYSDGAGLWLVKSNADRQVGLLLYCTRKAARNGAWHYPVCVIERGKTDNWALACGIAEWQ